MRLRCGLLGAVIVGAVSQVPVTSQAPQASAAITVWTRRSDVPGTQYVEVENVDLQQTVSKFKARWMTQAKLDVDPSLVTLRLVKCGARKPTAKQEAKAKVLDDPRLTLAEAGLADGCSMLASVTKSACRHVSVACVWASDLRPAQAHRFLKHLWLLVNSPCVSWTPLRSRCVRTRLR